MTDETGGQANTDPAGDQATGAEGADAATQQAQGDQAAAAADGTTASAEGAGKEGQGDTPAAPETYAFTMPDGLEMDQALADSVTPVFKELGLTQEQADKLVGAYAGQVQAQQQAVQDAFQKQLDDWTTELKTDPEVGGESFEKNAGIAAKAIEKFGSPELKAMLDSTGVGSNPAMFKFALAVGRFLSEDQPGSGSAATENLPKEVRMYPNEARMTA